MGKETYESIGCTPAILIPKSDGVSIKRGEDYFAIQVCSVQAAFTGKFWEKANRIIVSSNVSFTHPLLGEQVIDTLHRSREVKKDHAEQLGLSPNLTTWIPAMMDNLSVSFDFILDKQNRLLQLTDIINDDALSLALSFAPMGVAASNMIGGLSRKLINTFLDTNERQPILQFEGHFNLMNDGLQEGHYAILGTRDDNNPLPRPLPDLRVNNCDLLANGTPITNLSYILLEITRLEALGREYGIGQPWYKKLCEAEKIAQDVDNEGPDEDERKVKFKICLDFLKEMRALLNIDPCYLPRETEAIYQAAFKNCKAQIFGVDANKSRLSGKQIGESEIIIDEVTKKLLNVNDEHELDNAVATYAEQLSRSRAISRAVGIKIND